MRRSSIINYILRFSAFVLILFLAQNSLYSQCLDNNNIQLEINENQLSVDFSGFSGDLTRYNFRLYRYDDTSDFISVDLSNINDPNITFNRNKKEMIISNIPPGDYLLIFDNNSCGKLYIGEGFSGFPDSGLRFE